jgi:hypothetical protein
MAWMQGSRLDMFLRGPVGIDVVTRIPVCLHVAIITGPAWDGSLIKEAAALPESMVKFHRSGTFLGRIKQAEMSC